MTEKLIALIDGSIYSRSVCDNAAWIASRTGTPVELLHVLGRRETASADLSGSIALGARTALLEELSGLDEQRSKLAQKRGRAILEDAEEILRSAGIEKVTSRLRHGDVLEEVAESESGAHGIVIGKRGEAADFAKLHLGSNLERLARAATKPVFVAARAFRPIEKVLIAYDGGPSVMKAVDHIARAPLFAGLDIRLLTVGSENADRLRRLEDARATLAAGGHQASTEIASGQPEDAISDVVERDGIDLLVMGAYGHSRIRAMIIGSTTAQMIRSCKIPVVLFR
ncbi:universal stress protein [Aliihoeflea sp. 40Bstr573]|uniref:universal stress protein n=1 Tax=Aliihoeflea sp. 40Bstr573 TaxID=2696467 RepID=UPI002095DE79|nr:universal stress protein [Aliihoeflea sp. 40Bstr573]MCO6388980.1 universal stress protein [Aliihoeflea sp. 40Bstr573]